MRSCTLTHFVNCDHQHKDSMYRLEKPHPSLASLCPVPSLLPRMLSVAHSRGKTRTIPRPIDASTISPGFWAPTSATWSGNNRWAKQRLQSRLLGTVRVAWWRTLSESRESIAHTRPWTVAPGGHVDGHDLEKETKELSLHRNAAQVLVSDGRVGVQGWGRSVGDLDP